MRPSAVPKIGNKISLGIARVSGLPRKLTPKHLSLIPRQLTLSCELCGSL